MSVAMVNSNLFRPWLAQASSSAGQQNQQKQNSQDALKSQQSPAFGQGNQQTQTPTAVQAVNNQQAQVQLGLNELLAAMVNPTYKVNEVYQTARREASFSYLA